MDDSRRLRWGGHGRQRKHGDAMAANYGEEARWLRGAKLNDSCTYTGGARWGLT
jgi:hypothetical protein